MLIITCHASQNLLLCNIVSIAQTPLADSNLLKFSEEEEKEG